MTFSEKAWGEIAPIYAAILNHPFIRELTAGTLSKERFKFYMVQDALYLTEFSRVLSLVAARAPDPDTMMQFDESARNALIVERALHETFFREFGITGDVVADAERASVCFTYTNYLLATAHRSPVEVAVSAVLPCFWIYWEVGKHVRAEATPSNPYRLWIDTYGDEVFGERVRNVIATADAMAASAAPAVLDGMMHAFRRASQLEWMFWDSAYRLETWPV
jgi:thiaminase/transcriptional activator TenA